MGSLGGFVIRRSLTGLLIVILSLFSGPSFICASVDQVCFAVCHLIVRALVRVYGFADLFRCLSFACSFANPRSWFVVRCSSFFCAFVNRGSWVRWLVRYSSCARLFADRRS